MILTVSEIVSSIKGEGKNAGYPTTFIKLNGCNLNCDYCENNFKTMRRKRMSIPTALSCVFKMGNKFVDIVGGEPLLQESIQILIYDLISRDYDVTLHTNGTIPIEECLYNRSYSYCMEVKCPGSNMDKHNLYDNFSKLHLRDEVKFNIVDIEDYVFAKDVIKKYPTKASFIFSPLVTPDGKHSGKDLAHWILEDKIPRAKLGIPIQTLLGIE